MHAKYGPTIRIAPDELSFTSPEAWSQIYNNKPQLQKTPYHFPPTDSQMPDSMITASDAEHARLRRLTGPGFTGSGLAEVEPVLQHYSDLLISQLTIASGEGPQNLVEWFLWTLNDVIGQLALDQKFECLEKRRMHQWPGFLLGSLKSAAALNQLRRFGLLRLAAPFIPKKILKQRDIFVEIATNSIKQRLEREEKSEDGKRPDFIGLMLREMKGHERLSEAEIRVNSVLLVGGGAETTSTCLSALVYHLCKTPRVMKKLQDEIRQAFNANEEITLKATAKLPYLLATIDETLRIFSVASYITPRVTPKGGHTIAGQWIPGNVRNTTSKMSESC
jgi:aspirochlorine biosynthesis cytochrome P450 monooxygenase